TRRLDRLPADRAEVERDLEWLGIVGLLDPPRPEAAAAIARCREAGIRVVMITGDHPATAAAIARALGLVDGHGEVLTGAALDALSDEAFDARVESIRVYARAAPEQKIRIVRALQARGAFVAMTGDGVNDAPALAQADIGIAMGKGGTDVAREASHLVLLDDNFATIVNAVAEGRRIYDNLRRFVRYALSGNGGEIWALFLAPFVGLPLPLLPIHILWVNLVTDGLPGLALAAEPAEPGVMRRPPRPPDEHILGRGLGAHVVWVGLLIGGLTLGVAASPSPRWQTMAFTVLALAQMAHAMAIRSERESLFTLGLGTNPALLGAVALTLGLQLAVVYVPFLQRVFETQALTAGELGVCLGLASSVFVAVELEKAWIRAREPA
ncbi:MAG: HAD-IC family P-type ATPase, partial [Myxococcota bacterium]